jgi:hypothetical protein
MTTNCPKKLSLQRFFARAFRQCNSWYSVTIYHIYPNITSERHWITFHPYTPKCIIISFEQQSSLGGHFFLFIHWIYKNMPSSG